MLTAIKINNLTKKYHDTVAVDNLNLTIGEGQLFALLGVNGAGKTTTVKMLSTLLKPTSGEAYIYNYSISKNQEEIRKIMDISMQETAIARHLTVEENIDFYSKLSMQSKAETEKIKKEIYSLFSLDKVAKKRSMELSGGWQRKLSIALALVKRPKILFLDEPTLGLDVLARRELWNTINLLRKNMTIILTTHYMEEAEALADKIGIMNKGKLVFVGTKEELYNVSGKTNVEDAFVEIVSGGRNE